MSLPNPWNLYNLIGSPFFQGILEASDHPTRPLTLFVGREAELQRLLGAIVGAGAHSTRHAIAGAPGVGKTTLVQELKAKLIEDGYFASADHVPVLSTDTPASLFLRILASVYEILLLARPHLADNLSMQEAQALVRVHRHASANLSVSVAGFGIGGGGAQNVQLPADPLASGLGILRALLTLVRTAGARGIVLHLNNLENLSDAEAAHAADVLRSLRDLAFQQDGIHTLIVGTTDAVQAAVNQHAQMRSVFSTVAVAPLPLADVHALLRARYAALRLAPNEPAGLPVDDAAVDILYEFYRGDLRGLLKALEEGVGASLPLGAAAPAVGAARPALPLGTILPILQDRARTQLTVDLPSRASYLTQWGTSDPTALHTQATLKKLWKISQAAVSTTLDELTQAGYVVRVGMKARAVLYGLSGTSRVIFAE